MNKRGGISISIVLFVFWTLIVTGFVLFLANSSVGDIESNISPSLFMTELYDQEARIEFYVDTATKEAIKESGSNTTKEKFLNAFISKIELTETDAAGKKIEEEGVFERAMKQVREQADSAVTILGKEVIITFNIELEVTGYQEGIEIANAVHKFDINHKYSTSQ